jgi:hypothetical protein
MAIFFGRVQLAKFLGRVPFGNTGVELVGNIYAEC